MKSAKYTILINTTEAPTGTLNTYNASLPFNPTTILCDSSYKNTPLEHTDLFFDDWDYLHEYAFGDKLKIENREQYYKLIITIKKMILESQKTNAVLNYSNIDFLRSFFDITYQFTPMRNMKNLQHFDKAEMRPVIYSMYHIDTALSFSFSDITQYFYECYSMSDVVFAILHFLASRQYKFNICAHCGRYFATTSYKQKYCFRKSPMQQYKHLNCEQAVRNITQEINRGYKRIYNNLYQNHSKEPSILSDFLEKYNTARNDFNNYPNIENIEKCFAVLDKKQWY